MKLFKNVDDSVHQYDYSCLANYCQRHTKHTKYCFKPNSDTCRFGYPKKEQPISQLILNEKNNQYEYVSKRNDALMNGHDRFMLELWRANMDLQSIISLYAVINYIAKYTSKSEKKSNSFDEFIKLFLQNENEFKNMGLNEFVTKTLMKNIVNRDYSAQETCFYLMSYQLVQCSRSFKKIYLNFDEDPFVFVNFPNHSNETQQNYSDRSKDEDPQNNTQDDSNQLPLNNFSNVKLLSRKINYLKEYENRSPQFNDRTFPQFFAKTYKKNKQYVERKNGKDTILQITPSIFNKDPEIAAKMQIIMNFPFRNLQSLFNISWQNTLEILKESHNSILNSNNLDLELQNYIEQNESESEEENFEPIRETNQFMAVSSTGPNMQLANFPLGMRDDDIVNYDWANNFKSIDEINAILSHHYSTTTNGQFLNAENSSNNSEEIILNTEQQKAIDLFNVQLLNVLNNNETPENDKLVICQGVAGSGKSTIIKYITKELYQKLGSDHFSLLAPTGLAALNINGSTIHSRLKIYSNGSDPENQNLLEFQKEFENVKFIIIDEYSMVGFKLLVKIESRLRLAKNNDEKFGGLFV